MASFNFIRCQQPPLAIFDGLPSPPLPPIFKNQNDGKGCTLDYLDGLGRFLFWFGGDREKSRGSGNQPPPPWEDEG